MDQQYMEKINQTLFNCETKTKKKGLMVIMAMILVVEEAHFVPL